MNDLPSEPHGGARDAGPATRPAPMPAAKVRNRLFINMSRCSRRWSACAAGERHFRGLVLLSGTQGFADPHPARTGRGGRGEDRPVHQGDRKSAWLDDAVAVVGRLDRATPVRCAAAVASGPAITELSQLDATGKERLRVSRLAMDVVDSGTRPIPRIRSSPKRSRTRSITDRYISAGSRNRT